MELVHGPQDGRSLAAGHFNSGLALQRAGRSAEAAAAFRLALEQDAGLAVAWLSLGNVYCELGRLEEAVSYIRQAIVVKPDFAEAYNNLGLCFEKQQDSVQAAACFSKAVSLKSDYADAWQNWGLSLLRLGDWKAAIEGFQRALEIKPEHFEAQLNMGGALRRLDQLRQAETCYRRAIELLPGSAEAHNNLASALMAQGALDAAEASYSQTLAINPELADTRLSRATLWLLKGDFERGWPEYEWRWRTGQLPVRAFAWLRWQGEALAGKTILAHAEQGLGDTLQFVRYARLLQGSGAHVVFECQSALQPLLASCAGIDVLIGEEVLSGAGKELPEIDYHVPLLSVPGILGTTLAGIPRDVPYLFANVGLVSEWHVRLADLRGMRIGINWRGRAGIGDFRKRDIPLDQFATLASIENVRLISLQRGEGREELLARPLLTRRVTEAGGDAVGTAHPTIFDLGDEVDTVNDAFMDTAAIMMNLDLVITSDTAVAHLAGALGVPVWVALPFVPDWRWLLERSDSPWYPTMRLFRQKSAGDWAGVFQEIEAAIGEIVGEEKNSAGR